MTTPIVLTGDTTVFGTAPDNSGTDSFLVYGAGNTIIEGTGSYGGGNLVVYGGDSPQYGWDTGSTIYLGNATQVNDQITLDGNQNSLVSLPSQALYQSTVNLDVTGLGLAGPHPGDNVVALDNEPGSTTLNLAGSHDSVGLNGDATNTVRLGGGYGAVTVGTAADGDFGYTTSLKLGGTHNSVTGGDENFTVTGGNGHDQVVLGDGNNDVHENGIDNAITVWGGTNLIDAGTGADTVYILGAGGQNGASYVYNPNDPLAGPPTDSVSLAGAKDVVDATYENVNIYGVGVTGNAQINLGTGNNAINLAGDLSAIALGDGTNNVELTGNTNSVTVADSAGIGTDNVTVGNGAGNVVSLDRAGGSVAGTGLGLTTVTQAANTSRVVDINLNNGIGAITVGSGADVITANGASTRIAAGNGSDTITANGANAAVTAGNGADTVNANGGGAAVTLGNGPDTINANGGGAHVTAGNGNDSISANGLGAVVRAGNGNDLINANGAGANVTAGLGNDTVNADGGSSAVVLGWGNDVVSATGPGSSVTISGLVTPNYVSNDTVTVGSSDTVRISSATATVTGLSGDNFYINGLQPHSNILASGDNNNLFIGSDSSLTVQLNQAEIGNTIMVQADTNNTYSGVVNLFDFNTGDHLDLEGLVGKDGLALNSYVSVLENISAGSAGDTLSLAGGGAIVFDSVTPFTSSEFIFGTHTGAV